MLESCDSEYGQQVLIQGPNRSGYPEKIERLDAVNLQLFVARLASS